MTYGELVNYLYTSPIGDGERLGQSMMNKLHDVNSDMYWTITSEPDLDPFFDDSLIPNLLEFLAKSWNGSWVALRPEYERNV